MSLFSGLYRSAVSSILRPRCISLGNPLKTVEHDVENKRFTMQLPLDTAYVGYFSSNKALNLYSIFVPKKYREIGIGQELARDVLEYCAENNIHVILSCPYLVTFYRQHSYPRFRKIVKGVVVPRNQKVDTSIV